MSHGGARVGAGKKVLPMTVKIAKGTYRPHRAKELPTTSKSKPVPPRWLNTSAKKVFRHMAKRLDVLGIATASHTEALSLLSSRVEEVQRLSKYLDEKNVSYRDFNGRVHPRPEVSMRNEAVRHMHSLLVEFGLTPSAMNRIGRPKEKGKKNEFEGF